MMNIISLISLVTLIISGCATAEHSVDQVYRNHLELIPAQRHSRISYRCNSDFNCRFVWIKKK